MTSLRVVLPGVAKFPGGFFLHAHFMDAHQPYVSPEEYLAAEAALDPLPYNLSQVEGYTSLMADWPKLSPDEQALALAHLDARYRGSIRYLDDVIAEVRAELSANGVLDETLLVVTNDHGEQLYERGSLGHGYDLYPEENASFAVFWSTSSSPVVWDAPTTHADLAPTILEILGLPPGKNMHGTAVGSGSDLRPIFSLATFTVGAFPTAQVVQVEEVRMHYRWDGEKGLYYNDVDPTEINDVYDPASCDVTFLWESALNAEIRRVRPLVDDEPVDDAPAAGSIPKRLGVPAVEEVSTSPAPRGATRSGL